MKCKICHTEAKPIFTTKVLNKYDVQYYRCPNCEFIQTEKPVWLKEAYHHAITDLDIGLIYRNLEYSKIIYKTIVNSFNSQKQFLDFAGGYGIFVRLMRDMGLNFFHQDKYCENIFATNHSIEKAKESKFEALTTLEVFEHLNNPLEEINKMFFLSDTIIFSTEIIPEKTPTKPEDWWYFIPETGQHIAFYSEKTLIEIAKHFKSNYFRSGNLHMFTKVSFKDNPFTQYSETKTLPSLLQSDYEFAKKILNKQSPSSKSNRFMNLGDTFLDKLIKITNQKKILNKKYLALDNKYIKLLQDFNKIYLERNDFENRLRKIYESKGWKILRHIYLTKDKIIPPNSNVKNIFKSNISIIKQLNQKSRIHKRKINLKSRKLIYIDHIFHQNKTKSTSFVVDILKKHFKVEKIWHESWQGDNFPDLSHIDKSYIGVIFFQVLPPPDVYKKINNPNIIFFPMFDGHGNNPESYWRQYPNLKIINFSKTLHDKLSSWGFDSTYIQYFPKPMPFIKNKTHKAFFWQRINYININTVDILLEKIKTKIHLHRHVDPNQTFITPSSKQIKKYNITYSDWFETREEMQQKIQECDIYIAPRQYEGIGLSFLEAMAMGKAVIAVNNPTMNEYITDGKTGYLFEMENPQPINLSNLDEVRKSTYSYMKKGWTKWRSDKAKIIEFIKK